MEKRPPTPIWEWLLIGAGVFLTFLMTRVH